MLNRLQGSRLGIWAAHGEGKFIFPEGKNNYAIAGKYAYDAYPSNPNGSDHNTAMLSSDDGRHLVMMPHLSVLYSHGTGEATPTTVPMRSVRG